MNWLLAVIALDISPVRLALARHNAALYGVEDRIEFVLADFLSFARTLNRTRHGRRKIDVVFLSPPWGGPTYLSGSGSPTKGAVAEVGVDTLHAEYGLESIRPIHGKELFDIARGITRNVAYFLPRNTNLAEISGLVSQGDSQAVGTVEMIEVEEEWTGSKLKALTCYFGGLVAGQEGTFDE